jgi:hypothetical protein
MPRTESLKQQGNFGRTYINGAKLVIPLSRLLRLPHIAEDTPPTGSGEAGLTLCHWVPQDRGI